ncbi:MAG: DNA recombination protein RmuC [Sulfurimonas sp.]|uniref:DNA recombination protein RmuC n=1 Tax=Sulfurimonas sp. TaxID=2022749 RepID=UPI0025DA3B0E|nr:DNA recombination protein RmuC [Sulfurimonas sp.]MCK9491160.1 DNA recombination protein RmuC [Sulfurimonas sp.]
MDLYLALLLICGVIIVVLLYLYISTLQAKNDLRMRYAILNNKYDENIKSHYEKIEMLQSAKEELSKEFRLLANEIFETKSKSFNHTHKEHFEMLLRPFREQIANFSNQSKEQFTYETKERHLLKDELVRLKEMNAQLSQDALNLTSALKGENKTQGNWGEIILARILEESGLREGIEYKTQVSLKSDEGRSYRPDVVIHMPQKRDIIIDSKVSLVAYERFIKESDEKLKSLALREHLSSINTHIKELSAKKYDALEGVNTLDFTLLFMPIEGAFHLALDGDGEFFKRAYDSNILVVSPSTLLVTLRTIEHIWRTKNQEDHAQKIVSEAEAMYEKLVLFVDEMLKVKEHLVKAQDSYDISMKRLKSGKGNIIKRAENLVELGLKPKKELSIISEE